MGLIQAAVGALHGTIADQWKEYFYCESMDSDILVKRGVKKNGSRIFEDNVIADGSRIAVADGQCMIVVENGQVMDVCAEPGAYIYDTKTSPTDNTCCMTVMEALKSIPARENTGTIIEDFAHERQSGSELRRAPLCVLKHRHSRSAFKFQTPSS